VIPAIRNIDPDGLVIVGTPTWSQDVDTAAADPLTYAIHFYVCTHGQSLRDKVSVALSQGAAIFSTEFGLSSGDDGACEDETTTWLNFFDNNNISWANKR